MTDTLAAGQGALKQGAELVRQAKADLDAKLKALRSTVDGIGAGWTGAGRQAFDTLMLTWGDETAKLTGSLTKFEESLLGTDQALSANEDETSANFAKFTGRLGRS